MWAAEQEKKKKKMEVRYVEQRSATETEIGGRKRMEVDGETLNHW